MTSRYNRYMKSMVYRSLTPQIAPMVYIMMTVSVIIGFCFATGLGVSPETSILFSAGTIVDRGWWGAGLCASAFVSLAGMICNRDRWISTGALGGFAAWGFAATSILFSGNIYGFVTFGLFHLVFMGYVFLATTLGVLRRLPVGTDWG